MVQDRKVTGEEFTCVVCSPTKAQVGSPFTHWGHSKCPASADFVYAGVSAIKFSSIFCLPLTAVVEATVTGNLGYNLIRAAGLYLNDIPKASLSCAVCLTRKSRSVLMIPDKCPKNWTPEYTGILCSGLFDERICVAQPAEELPNIPVTSNIRKNYIHITLLYNPLDNGAVNFRYNRGEIPSCSVCSAQPESVVFTRWGKTSCPKGSVTKYSGFVLGHEGYICKREDSYKESDLMIHKSSFYDIYGILYKVSDSGFKSEEFKRLNNKLVIHLYESLA